MIAYGKNLIRNNIIILIIKAQIPLKVIILKKALLYALIPLVNIFF